MESGATVTRPKAVVFDLGKVLLEFDYGIALRRLVPRVRLDLAGLHRLIDQSELLFEYETGLVSTNDFFDRVCQATGYEGSLTEFGAVFADIFSEIGPMVTLHGELRRAGIPTYLLSNTNELAVGHIRNRFPFFSQFDGHFLSYEHRSMKPAPRLYEVVEEWSGLRGPDLFYLDDRTENVGAALERGWQARVHETPEASRAALAAAGLLNGAGRLPG
jgi:FMN phosphatase YigB (HAD superfamily)